MVIVGTTSSIVIPELPRSREHAGRLRGLRLLHTHLTKDLLSQEDLMDLLFLRFDNIDVLTVNSLGQPEERQHAHLLPANTDQKSYLTFDPEPWDSLERDFFSETVALEEELARHTLTNEMEYGKNKNYDDNKKGSKLKHASIAGKDFGAGPESRAILVSISTGSKKEQESSLAELAELASSAGVYTAGTLTQRVHTLNPRLIMGKGKLAELEVLALQGNAGLIIFDSELSPAQLKNLTKITERRVLDRTQLILDIFAQKPSSKAGKFQVELAQLQYMLPRLVGKSGALDRLAGGIGGRGPGETKLETDRRRIRDKITRIKRELKTLRLQRSYARNRRSRENIPIASLVGYTNAGKSTLLNRLTGASVFAENKLFSTLDPTTRRLRFPFERELVLTDTVGFIRSLPKELVEAFQATLEGLEEADLLLHVADASHPEVDDHIKAVMDILSQLNLQETPSVLVLNKIDLLDSDSLYSLRMTYPDAIYISAESGNGLDDLTSYIVSHIDWESTLVVPHENILQ